MARFAASRVFRLLSRVSSESYDPPASMEDLMSGEDSMLTAAHMTARENVFSSCAAWSLSAHVVWACASPRRRAILPTTSMYSACLLSQWRRSFHQRIWIWTDFGPWFQFPYFGPAICSLAVWFFICSTWLSSGLSLSGLFKGTHS